MSPFTCSIAAPRALSHAAGGGNSPGRSGRWRVRQIASHEKDVLGTVLTDQVGVSLGEMGLRTLDHLVVITSGDLLTARTLEQLHDGAWPLIADQRRASRSVRRSWKRHRPSSQRTSTSR